jgi:hypothetical protein
MLYFVCFMGGVIMGLILGALLGAAHETTYRQELLRQIEEAILGRDWGTATANGKRPTGNGQRETALYENRHPRTGHPAAKPEPGAGLRPL